MNRLQAAAALATIALLATACGDDTDGVVGGDISPVEAGKDFPGDRCDANKEAGTITYLTGFDYAAAASITEVLVADAAGYYDDLCLDVEIQPSFSTANYPLVAANEAQFSSAGSFAELASQSRSLDADLVAMSVDGHVAIDVLMVKPDRAGSLADLAGQTIGVKGALPPAVAAMLQQEAGMTEGDQYETTLLDGFNPFAHWELDEVSAVPGWRSNEPGALASAGIEFDVYDPSDYGIPGSFGIIYTNREFMSTHPSAAEDFMRATMKGLADAIADPTAAGEIAYGLIEANGNPNFLSAEGEAFRWSTDADTIVASTPAGSAIGAPIADELTSQIEAYAEVGYFGEQGAPSIEGRFDDVLVASLYDADGTVIWPA